MSPQDRQRQQSGTFNFLWDIGQRKMRTWAEPNNNEITDEFSSLDPAPLCQLTLTKAPSLPIRGASNTLQPADDCGLSSPFPHCVQSHRFDLPAFKNDSNFYCTAHWTEQSWNEILEEQGRHIQFESFIHFSCHSWYTAWALVLVVLDFYALLPKVLKHTCFYNNSDFQRILINSGVHEIFRKKKSTLLISLCYFRRSPKKVKSQTHIDLQFWNEEQLRKIFRKVLPMTYTSLYTCQNYHTVFILYK